MRENGTIVSLQVGVPRQLGGTESSDPFEKPWRSGIYKDLVSGPIWMGKENLEGDGQADLRVHGGPHKAVLAYPAEHYPPWRSELGLADFTFGAFGENFTIDGLDENDVCIGDVFEIGAARVEVSQPRSPCAKLARKWRMKDLPARVVRTSRVGWYYRVLHEGLVASGMPHTLLERPNPSFTIAATHQIAFDLLVDRDLRDALAACPALSPSWRKSLAA